MVVDNHRIAVHHRKVLAGMAAGGRVACHMQVVVDTVLVAGIHHTVLVPMGTEVVLVDHPLC